MSSKEDSKSHYSEEVINFTKSLKKQAQAYSPWVDTGADLVGILPIEN